MEIRIRFLSGRDHGRTEEFDLADGGTITIGRSDECEVSLWDEAASRRHAQVEFVAGEWIVSDLGSANGVFVNGQQVRRVALNSGDQLAVGDTVLQVATGRFRERPTAIAKPSEGADERFTVERALSREAVQLGSRLTADDEQGRRLEALLNLVDRVQGAGDGAAIHRALLDGTARALNVERAAIIPCSIGSHAPLFDDAIHHADEARISRLVVETVLRDGDALHVSDLEEEAAPSPERHSIVRHGVASVIAVPIAARERRLGVLYLEGTTRSPFGEDELAFAARVAQIAGLALDAIERLDHSRRVIARRDRSGDQKIVTTSAKLDEARQHLTRFAGSGGPVLIIGETGTGKELVAQEAHQAGPYASGPWVPLNCAAIPSELLESELFGHEKGAFTGATGRREGMFELAHRGTLFLDEVGELPVELQPKLLRALESGEFYRIGGRAPVRVELLLLSATHRDLAAHVAAGRFREDLYYRLNRFRVVVPPLRERPEDIELIARHFLARTAQRLGHAPPTLSASAIERLTAYGWPGNVRELRNVIERAAVIATGEEILRADISLPDSPLAPTTDASAPLSTDDAPITIEEAEEAAIRAALRHTGGKKGDAAALLGIAWPTLRRKLKKYEIDAEDA